MSKALTSVLRPALFLALISASLASWAADPFRIRDIRVEGLQRVEAGTVFATLPFRSGDDYSDDKGTSAIRALFGLGLFQDVRVEIDGDVVIIAVQERPSVSDIQFTGLKEFDQEMIRKALKDLGLAEGRPFDRALADRAEQEIKRQYLNRAMYATQVVTTVTPLEKNQVRVNLSVTEGSVAKIRELRVVGVQAFKLSDILDLMEQNTGNWLSWYTKSDRYSQAKLNADLETIKSFYLNQGFVEFRIDSTQVAISPDKADVSITVNVSEGQRYAVSGVKLTGEYLGRNADFQPLVQVKPGRAYNVDDVTATVQAFKDRFAEYGYAFARVEAQPRVDRNLGTVEMVFQANPQQRVYVRRIEIEGNDRTRDEVIRREFRQMESAWYDGKLIKLSRDRVDRLGYFTEVSVQPKEVPTNPDQVDLVLKVVERPTGNLSIGAGYSQAEKLSLVAGIQQENVFGSGNYLGFNINTSDYNRELSITHTNPYFTQDGVSRTYDLSYKTQSPYDEQGGDYKIVSQKASAVFGVPFTETDKVFFGLGVESTKIEPGATMPLAYNTFISNFGSPAVGVPLTIGWSRDSRDSLLAPTQGRYQRANAEVGLAGDTRYVKASYQFQQYWPISKKLTLAVNTEVGLGEGLGGKPLPVFKNFYGGGLGSVRGFEQSTFGAKSYIYNPASPTQTDYGTPVSIGGDQKYQLNLEAIMPFPGSGNDKTLRWFGFVDTGTVKCSSGDGAVCGPNGLRVSAGLGISWISPVGPLRLAWAKAIQKESTDVPQTLQFQIGTNF